jgi:hypothetical protein
MKMSAWRFYCGRLRGRGGFMFATPYISVAWDDQPIIQVVAGCWRIAVARMYTEAYWQAQFEAYEAERKASA